MKDDTISRQAAIDEIEERRNANEYSNVALISELNRLEGYIMRLPSVQPEQRWIPCEEALPEDSNFYIVTRKDFLVGFIWYSVRHGWEWQEKEQPIAWMPLPEPYKEEGGE